MNIINNSPVDRSMRLIYDWHGIDSNSEIGISQISEMLYMIDGFCHNIALHCIRVSNYATAIAKELRLTDSEIRLLWCAALFHDIGKINIPKEILDKPAKLTQEEYNIVKTHSNKGYEILRKNAHMEEISEIILYHHERFDGWGYPTSIAGDDIPLMSRIIAVADAFDAMTTERPYSNAFSLEKAVYELERGRKTQFDGNIVDCFITLLGSSTIKPNVYNVAFGLI